MHHWPNAAKMPIGNNSQACGQIHSLVPVNSMTSAPDTVAANEN
jgi:hypothetical protein